MKRWSLYHFRRWLAGKPNESELAQNSYLEDGQPAPPKIDHHAFSELEFQALVRLLEQLDLKITPADLITSLKTVSGRNSITYLIGLLNYFIGLSPAPPTAKLQPPLHRPKTLTSGPPLNILFITGEFPNPKHGGGARVADFIRILSRNHNVYLYSAYHEHLDADALPALAPFCSSLKLIQGHQPFIKSHNTLRAFVSSIPVDIVHYEWPRALVHYDRTLGRFHIFTYMEAVSLRLRMDMDQYPLLSNGWNKLMTGLLTALKAEVVDTSVMDVQIVTTRKDQEFYSRLNPHTSYVVVNHGVDLEQFILPEVAPDDSTITFVGNFGHYPNIEAVDFFFTRIFELVGKQLPGLKVYIVGSNPTTKMRAYHDGIHIIVTGEVDDIRPYIQKASVCIAPLISGAGLRSKVIQYAALNRPCVATSIAIAGLNFTHERNILVADDPSKFAQHIVELLTNPVLARQIAADAYQQVIKHYDMHKIVDKLYAIYASLDGKVPS
jgi:glycosyltransferase involved in cell wall biosynthesis